MIIEKVLKFGFGDHKKRKSDRTNYCVNIPKVPKVIIFIRVTDTKKNIKMNRSVNTFKSLIY